MKILVFPDISFLEFPFYDVDDVWFCEMFSTLYVKGQCYLVGFHPISYKSRIVQKEAQIQQSPKHLTNSHYEFLVYP